MHDALESAPLTTHGEMAEWSNAPDSKSGIRFHRIEGSNPSLSARYEKGFQKMLEAFFIGAN